VKEEDIKRIFSKKLEILMIKKGKIKMDLSKELNIPYSSISDLCLGKIYPRPEKIMLLAEYFGVKYDDLVKIGDWEE
jgi:repressor LexA